MARGNVKVVYADHLLKADVITYNQQTNIVTASGNISLTQPTGDVTFANYMELTGDYKDGIIKEIRTIMQDDAKLAAVLGTRTSGTQTQMNKVVYSPCKLCRADPSRPPVWQIKSQTALWDHTAHDIIYTDASLEFLGVPVLYTPYFRHPDPHIKRRSGFLTPSIPQIGATTDHGGIFIIPYHHVISRDKDITLSPLITTKGGAFLSPEYRQRYSNGKLRLGGSVGRAKRLVNGETRESNRARWHVDSSGRFNLNEDWRGGFDALWAGDQTYLRQYNYYGHSRENTLTNRVFTEGFYGRNYLIFEGLAFQGLRATDEQRTIPVIPLMNLHYLSTPRGLGYRWSLDANALAAIRNDGTDTRRLSLKGGWKLPYTTDWGGVFTLGLSLRGDVYNNENFIINEAPLEEGNGVRGRFFPQAHLDWRWPFINMQNKYHIIIEPEASLVLAPTFGSQRKFPNEDSLILEPDDHNLLLESRFPGIDRIDDGSRLNYGIKASYFHNDFAQAEFFLGQTYNFNNASTFLADTGFDQQLSDFIGRAGFSIGDFWDFRYRFRIDRSNFRIHRNELLTSLGPKMLRLNLDYLRLPMGTGEAAEPKTKQIAASLSSEFTQGWTASIGTVRELEGPSKSLAHELKLVYEDECLQLDILLNKNFYRDRDVKPGTNLLFRIAFKNLGEVRRKQRLSHR